MIKVKKHIRISFSVILFLFPYLIYSQEYIPESYHHFKGDHWKQIQDIAVGREGEIFVAGDFEGVLNFDGQTYPSRGKRAQFIACIDSIGSVKWVKTYSCSNYSGITGIETGLDGMIYAVGWFRDTLKVEDHILTQPGRNHIYYLKFEPSGQITESDVLLPDFKGYVKSFKLDTSNLFILAGDFRRNITIGNKTYTSTGKKDIFLAKLTNEASIAKVFTLGGTGNDELKGIEQTNNEMILYGNFEREIELGDTLLKSAGKMDVFIVKRSSSGIFTNVLSIGGKRNDEVQTVVSDTSGNIYVSGQFKNSLNLNSNIINSEGENDVFLVKYNRDWQYISSQTWGGAGNDRPMGLVVNAKKQVFISGVYNKSIQFGYDTLSSTNRFNNGFLALFTESEGVKWVKNFIGESEESPLNLYLNGSSRILATGTFYNDLQFDSKTLNSRGLADAFLINYLDPCTLLKFNLPPEKTICLGGTDTLRAGSGFSNYLWNNGLSDNESLLVSDTGKYWVEITDSYGCKASDTIRVKRDSLFLNYVVEDEKMPEGNNGRIDLTFGGGLSPYTILWDNYEQTESLENLSEGYYQVKITDSNGCQLNEEIQVGRTVASGILDIYNFPNPMKDLTHIVYSLPTNASLEITLYDMTGRLVYVLYRGQNRKGKYEFDWNSGNLENGVYYLRIQTDKGMVSKKIMISRNN